MKRLVKKFVRKEDGQTLILIALMMVVLLGFAALVIDVGRLYVAKREMQNAADAGALAGAQDLPDADAAKGTAVDYAKDKNGADSAVAVTPYKGEANKIEVTTTKNVSYTFARILGFTDTDVFARAVGVKSGGGGFDSWFFAEESIVIESNKLGSNKNDPVKVNIHSNGTILIKGNNGKVYVDGSITAVGTLDITQITGNGNFINGIAQGSSVNVISSVDVKGGKVNSPAEKQTMPKFEQAIKDVTMEAIADGGNIINVEDSDYTISSNTAYDAVYVGGNLILNNNNITIKGPVYVGGNITVGKCNGLTINGVIYAGGDIDLSGGIDNITFQSLVYAPNGDILINNSNNFYTPGRIMAKRIHLDDNTIKPITGSDESDDFFLAGPVRLIE